MRSLRCLFILIALLGSCTKKNDAIISKQQFSIPTSGDTLKISLGNFGDEEGATIYKEPLHAELSRLVRGINSGSIVYQYLAVKEFTGTETVGFILSRGSDGASAGKKDTLEISILVK